MMRKSINFLALMLGIVFFSCFFALKAQKYEYKTVANDPLGVKEYTLPNGLKIFMSVNKSEPKIQTYIAVRVGSKHDPLETTGLAHYFEHMMFKGSSNFGTMDFEKEKPLLDAISDQYEVYRNLTSQEERLAAYKIIDSLSYEASKYAIPNEYDKLMSAIGSNNTNAFTSYDMTVYMEYIPSNQLENWAKIESDRLENMVLRLFHTEIETVYEEKNMSLTNDNRRCQELLMQNLFPTHPYGIHSVLGHEEHLKNPSIKNIQNFFDTYYVPNNMAIVLSGDFDPDYAVDIIEKYFGGLKAKEIPEFVCPAEDILAEPKEVTMVGLESPRVMIGIPACKEGSPEEAIMEVLSSILYNGQAGLIDINLNLNQKVLAAYAGTSLMVDRGALMMIGVPKAEQSLAEVKDLLLEQLKNIAEGNFPDWIINATIDNKKYELYKEFESNEDRGLAIAFAYVSNIPWEQRVAYIDLLSNVTKQDVMDYAKKLLGNNYVAIYKEQGSPNLEKIDKPAITPIETNRNQESQYLARLKKEASEVAPIEPLFTDYAKDIEKTSIANKIDLYYSHNSENPTFELTYLFDFGSDDDLKMSAAAAYMEYLGTNKYSSAQLQEEFYKIACSYRIASSSDKTYVTISGLAQNMNRAIELFEHFIRNCKADDEVLASVVSDILHSREISKGNQQSNANALLSYAIYGENSPAKNILSQEQLMSLSSSELIEKIHNVFNIEHSVLYYGPESIENVASTIKKMHRLPKKMQKAPLHNKYVPLETAQNRVVFLPYDANQSYCYNFSRGQNFSREKTPITNLYNTYFGTGMSAIVFQELREARSLAYQSYSVYRRPSEVDGYFTNMGLIITQNDKVMDALLAFDELYNNMPKSEAAFNLAKNSLLSDYRTARDQKSDKIFRYLNDKKFGYTENSMKLNYEATKNFELEDVVKFQEENIKNQTKTYVIMGRESDFDFEALEKTFGKVEKVSQEQVFGY